MVRRLAILLLLLCSTWALVGWVQYSFVSVPTWTLLDVTMPTSPRHPLNQGLVGHWQVLPQTNRAGPAWRSTAPLAPPLLGTLVNILPTSATSGWNATSRPGGYGEMRFDGANDAIDLGINSLGLRMHGARGVTIAAWVKYTSLAAAGDNLYVSIFGSANTAALRIGLPGATPGVVKFGGRSQAADGFQEVTSSAAVAADTWTHIVGVVHYNVALMKIYVNGLLDVSGGVTFGSTTFANTAGSTSDLFGATITGTYEFVGALDDIRLSTRALEAIDVAALYAATKTVRNTTLQSYPIVMTNLGGVVVVAPRRSSQD